MQVPKKIIVFLFPLVLLALLVVYRKLTYVPLNSVLRSPPPGAKVKPSTEENPRYVKALVKWKAGNYSEIKLEEELRVHISNLKIENSDQTISSEQWTLLRQSIYDMVLAFNRGTYKDYLRYRAPITNFTYNLTAIEAQKKTLRKFCLNPAETLPENPALIHQLLWERNFGGNAFSNYWHGIDWEASSILSTVERYS